MSCDIQIETASNVNQNCCCDSGFIVNPENKMRINKSSIVTYQAIDIIPDYGIEFTLDNGLIVIWIFTTMTARDTALANIDAEMNAKVV